MNTDPKKLEPRSKVCLFVGYPKETRGGYFYSPEENKVFVTTNAIFLEENHMRNHKPRSKIVLNELNEATNTSTRVVDSSIPSDNRIHPYQELGTPRRSGRVRKQPNRYIGLTEAQVVITDDNIEDPLSFKRAIDDVDKDEWIKAMNL